ncbi:hypothetical protein Poli38472_006972 [Pythium oligandrum]|uniref:Bzip transcription factor n=1 Tax=Pythium oligandrum TaxID=41045 RepID=A0A8K1CAD0_PYTOL|nr:hypothetical protein Poli38472_006972 [Pythium oligandrum]|eukprot:TMW58827.1 hypothetical protein Poli38472_006972 [Pythium oligandrum]
MPRQAETRGVKPRRTRAQSSARLRGKLYRERNKAHQVALERSVRALRKQVHHLTLLNSVRQKLAHVAPETRRGVLDHLNHYFHHEPAKHPQTPEKARMDMEFPCSQDLDFDVQSLDVQGTLTAPIVVMQGQLSGQHAVSTIERLYTCVPGNTALLEKLLKRKVAYPCLCMVYFDAAGDVVGRSVDVDFITRLTDAVGRLSDVPRLLTELVPSVSKQESAKSVETRAATPSLPQLAHLF